MFLYKAALFLSLAPNFLSAEENNVCSTFNDYFQIKNNPNCWYDPDIIGDVLPILKNHNYPSEVHTVTTADGYILTLFRIVRNDAKEILVFQPPMFGTATNYVKAGNKSLGFTMYEAGYDVWLINSRGTFYSKNHLHLTEHDREFWEYSFHEIGMYDYPAEFELIKNVTKRSDLVVVSYSMAGTASAIYASLLPQHAAEHVKIFINIAPTIYIPEEIRTPAIVSPAAAREFLASLGIYTVFLSYEMAEKSIRMNCLGTPLSKVLCALSLVRRAGGTFENFDPALLPIIMNTNPTRVPLKIFEHYHCIISRDAFVFFDYGPVGNLMRYNRESPPVYPLENMTVPFYMIHGERDKSAPIRVIDRLYREISDKGRQYGKHLIKGYNHIDFLYSKTSKTEVSDHIIELLDTKLERT